LWSATVPAIDFETAIASFLSLGRRLQETQPLTGQTILAELTAWYQNVRIEGAPLEEDADMLLLQWGATCPLVVASPTDLRTLDDDEFKFSDRELKYLDFTRQVFVQGDDEDFDDAAVQMSISLGFDPADGSEPNSNLWISTPADVDSAKAAFLGVPFVQALVNVPPRMISIKVGQCG
jgi:hypothetical protein